MKILYSILAGLLTLFVATSLIADDCWGCCESQNCGCGISFHADYLYWCSCVNGLAVAVKQRKDNPLKFNSVLFTDSDIVLINPGLPIADERALADGFLDIEATTRELFGFNFSEDSNIHENGKFLRNGCSSGVRVGFSYYAPCSCWGLNFAWTGYYPDAHESLKSDDKTNESVIPYNGLALKPLLTKAIFRTPVTDLVVAVTEEATVTGPIVPVAADFPSPTFESIIPLSCRFDHIKADWDLDLNIFDLEFGRDFACGCFAFRPHADLRFARIDQELTVKSQGAIILQGYAIALVQFPEKIGIATIEAKQTFKNEFCGVGPRFGMDTEWDLFCGLGFYGNFAVSLLYGDRDSSHKEFVKRETITERDDFEFIYSDIFNSGDLDDKFNYKRHNDHDCVSAITDVSLGLVWDWCVCGGCFGGTVKLGWEHHYFFNQGMGHVTNESTTMPEDNRDLAVHGLVASVGFGF